MLDLRYVKKLVEMLDQSSLDAIEISTEKGLKIRVSKAVAAPAPAVAAAPATVVVPVPPMTADLQALRPSPAAGIAASPEPAVAPPPASTLSDVKSPMVGTFYAAAEPGAKPFASVGMRVAKGQVLCIIEAMKIMNEIESEHAGVIREVLATDAHPVEYGQVMFRIDPNG